MTAKWELISTSADDVRRLAVPGGWLYQVYGWNEQRSNSTEVADYTMSGWHPPVFVPDLDAGKSDP
jgi:hypothetical protein